MRGARSMHAELRESILHRGGEMGSDGVRSGEVDPQIPDPQILRSSHPGLLVCLCLCALAMHCVAQPNTYPILLPYRGTLRSCGALHRIQEISHAASG